MSTSKIRIIDYSGMAYRYMYGGAPALTHVVDGVQVNTTIAAYTIKEIYRLAEGGEIPTAVVFDGGKAIKRAETLLKTHGVVYKDGRKKQHPLLYQGIDLTYNILDKAGVYCYRLAGIEADDIVFALAKKAESQGYFVEIFTGDSDLLTLVNHNITVYYRSKNTIGDIKNYQRVTPESFVNIVSGMTTFKGFYVPYNTTYFFKLIRGDTSDNIPGFNGYGAKKYNDLMCMLDVDGIDMGGLTADNFQYIYNFMAQYQYDGNDSGFLDHMVKNNKVMEFMPLEVVLPTKFLASYLQKECSTYGINLPVLR